MLPKLIAAVACIVCLIALGAMGLRHNQQKGQAAASWQETDSLVAVARRAKAEGQDKARISGLRIDYAGADIEPDKALKNYSVLIAEPIESKGFPQNRWGIQTWYKFRILETLSRKGYCPTCSMPVAELPQEMGQPNYDEFFAHISGGVLNIEGVEITQPYDSLHFEEGNKYLMFVNLAPSQVAVIIGGPTGVFQLDKNDALHSLNKEGTLLNSELQKRFGLRLSEFRSHVSH